MNESPEETKIGRPTVFTEEVVRGLEAAFRDGAHVYEACKAVGIDPSTYYKKLKIDETFSTRMSLAQEYITELARGVVARTIQKGDDDNSKWWLERKAKAEFSTKSEVQSTVQVEFDESQVEKIAKRVLENK